MIQHRLNNASGAVMIENIPIVQLIWTSAPSTSSSSNSNPGSAPAQFPTPTGASTPTGGPFPPSVTVRLNESQRRAVHYLCANPTSIDEPTYSHPRIQIVQGPPGSGKTTLISAMVQWLASRNSRDQSGAITGTGGRPKGAIYLVAQSNVAVRNIAVKLHSIGFQDYKLIVSTEFKNDW